MDSCARRGPGAPGSQARQVRLTIELPAGVGDVLDVVDAIPAGGVRTYGDVAALVGRGPRYAGYVMARYGHLVPWWRVVNAAGDLPRGLRERAQDQWRAEGTPRRPDGRVDLTRARLPRPDDEAAHWSVADAGRDSRQRSGTTERDQR